LNFFIATYLSIQTLINMLPFSDCLLCKPTVH